VIAYKIDYFVRNFISSQRKMAMDVMKLNSGFDMPVIGLGTWQVCSCRLASVRGRVHWLVALLVARRTNNQPMIGRLRVRGLLK